MVHNKPASAYAKPHTMRGGSVTVSENPGGKAQTKGRMARGPMA